MQEEIFALAKTLANAGEKETEYLALLCQAAEKDWLRRLGHGVAPADCPFISAAALTAAAGLADSRCGGAASFSVGDVSVTEKESGKSASALRRQAERLMSPYVEAEDFCFRGVRG